MAFFKAICAKNKQKIELMLQFDNIEVAKEYLKKEWYAVIEIKETENDSISTETWWIFYFDILLDWKIKTGQINSDDIFKAYVKLVEKLNYNVLYIYDNLERTEKEKILYTQKIKNSYEIYKQNISEQQKEEKLKEAATNRDHETWNNDWISDHIMKELNHYYILIDKVLEKIRYIQVQYTNELSAERKAKLESLYNWLKQVRNLTNITKLKQIWEVALVKIWELQQEFIQNNTLDTKKDILEETNKLLKNFWSSKQIVLPEDDIKLKLEKIYKDFIESFKNFFKSQKNREKIDKNSWKYFDILREQNIYKNQLKTVNKQLFKSMFDKDQYIRLSLKQKLIKQNITLLENRIKNKKISYTKTVKWINYYKDIIFYLLQKIWDVFVYSILIYSVFFILLNTFIKASGQKIDINYSFIFYIVVIWLFWLLLK